jgi:CDP-diacylglycerol--glycerol-3-phosphate 3-phosphatidyltransferase
MNLPNKLTLSRLFLIPFIIWLIYIDNIVAAYSALVLFIIAMLTDVLDGAIAKKRNIETFFGKFLDPVTDKILILSIFIVFADKGWVPAWIVIVLLARELIVSGLRSAASAQGKIIGANWMGKIKAFTQTIIIALALFLNGLKYSFYSMEEIIAPVITGLTLLMVSMAIVFLFIFSYWNRKLIFLEM